MDDRVIGILGGGQLGRMLASAAALLNVKVLILDSGEYSPAKQIISPPHPLQHVDGSFSDADSIKRLAGQVDILTVEIEHIDTACLFEIAKSSAVQVHPRPSTIQIIQNKLHQKQHLSARGLPVAPYTEIQPSESSVRDAIQKLGMPLMLKSQTLAYDGRGNFLIETEGHVAESLQVLQGRPLYAEKWIGFEREIAVMVVRSVSGQIVSYPAVETVQKNNICHLVFAPLRTSDADIGTKAQSLAEKAVAELEGAGVYGVEMFLMANGKLSSKNLAKPRMLICYCPEPAGEIIVNEIAPRPHNSGHYTIEACCTSQFENHIRAILSLPLGSTALKVQSVAMLNLIGASSDYGSIRRVCTEAMKICGATVHLYGKAECRKGRKMGHITIVGANDAEVRERLRPILLSIENEDEASVQNHAPIRPDIGFSHRFPIVAIIMGSDSDLPVMLPGARILDRFNIPYELTIVSAHRTPDRQARYARSAASRGIGVIIAGAGGAAHLPGMVAAMTCLPVIGVPIKASSLDGVDSLHSIVQMPRGVPVATVGINNSTNAALLAVRIIGVADVSKSSALKDFSLEEEEVVMTKINKLSEVGWERYSGKA